MATPKPGRPVRGSTTGRPEMALLDLLGRRMALRVLWVLRDGPHTFRALLAAAETNPSVLNVRLRELREAGLVDAGAAGYALTRDGTALCGHLAPLARWARAWAKRVAPSGASAGR